MSIYEKKKKFKFNLIKRKDSNIYFILFYFKFEDKNINFSIDHKRKSPCRRTCTRRIWQASFEVHLIANAHS
jgi:hypothetical protein